MHAKIPGGKATGELTDIDDPSEKAANIQPTVRPTEYRCYIKEVFPICNSGRENPIVDKSFVRRTLPVPVALDARLSTLFVLIIHEAAGKVNTNYHFMEIKNRYIRSYCGWAESV